MEPIKTEHVTFYDEFDRDGELWLRGICVCGNEIERTRRYVLWDRCEGLSCGCKYPIDKTGKESIFWKGYEDISAVLYKKCELGAKGRGLEFNITIEDMWKQFIKQEQKCALTGVPLTIEQSRKNGAGNASLDRINSDLGYRIDNIQWVTKTIQLMKSKFNQDYFIQTMGEIVKWKCHSRLDT